MHWLHAVISSLSELEVYVRYKLQFQEDFI